MAGSGWKDWADGETISEGEQQGYIQDQTVMVFAITGPPTTTQITTGMAEGMMAYTTTDSTLWVNTAADGWVKLISEASDDHRIYFPNVTRNDYWTHDDTLNTAELFLDGASRVKYDLASGLKIAQDRYYANGVASDDYLSMDGTTFLVDQGGTEQCRFQNTDAGLASDVLRFNGVTANDYIQFNGTNDQCFIVCDGTEMGRFEKVDASNGIIQMNGPGSQAAPTYTFLGDTASGLYRNATSDVRLVGGGAWGLAAISGRPYGNLRGATGATAVSHTSLELLSGAASRREWKHNIESLDAAQSLDDLKELRPVSFTYDERHVNGDGPLGGLTPHRGFIAQEVAEAAGGAFANYGWISEDGWGEATINDFQERGIEHPTIEEAVPINWDRDHAITTVVSAAQGVADRLEKAEAENAELRSLVSDLAARVQALEMV